MTSEQKVEAGIGSFDAITVTEKFATENPELIKAFLEVTDEANASWTGSDEQVAAVAVGSGMEVEVAKSTAAGLIAPSAQEQIDTYFNEGGIAVQAAASLGLVFSGADGTEALAKTIDGSFLE